MLEDVLVDINFNLLSNDAPATWHLQVHVIVSLDIGLDIGLVVLEPFFLDVLFRVFQSWKSYSFTLPSILLQSLLFLVFFSPLS